MCETFKNYSLIDNAIPWEDSNLSRWNITSFLSYNPYDDNNPHDELIKYDKHLRNSPDMKMIIYFLDYLIINYGSYQSSFGLYDGFNSYYGIVGTATINNTNMSFPLVTPVAAANNDINFFSTSYLIINEGNKSPESICRASIQNCFVNNIVNFPFTKIDINVSFAYNSVEFSDFLNATFNINPGLQVYVCEYVKSNNISYDWAPKFSVITLIFISTLESLKAFVVIHAQYILNAQQNSLIVFSSHSPLILIYLLFSLITCEFGVWFIRRYVLVFRDLKDTNYLQLFGDLLLHSLPMLVLTIQNIIYHINSNHHYLSIISILSFVGNCIMMFINVFRLYTTNKSIREAQNFDEVANHYDELQQPKQRLLIFALIDCGINIFPLVFMISLIVQGFISAFIFIIPLMVALAKLVVCFSQFYTSRFRKPLKSPIVFSIAMNSPFLFFCINSLPIRQLVTITASSGINIWSCWPLDFVSVDIPILVTLVLMNIFSYGNSKDVTLLQNNYVLVILVTFYLIWRIISGFWYLSISLSIRAGNNNDNHDLSIETTKPPTLFNAFKLSSPICGILIYTLLKLGIWVIGLRTIISMIFMPEPDPKILVVLSPKILMVLGLIIYLSLDFIGSLVLLISYYGPFSIQTLTLYVNSSFLIFFYTLLGHQFRVKIFTAINDNGNRLLIWKLRDLVLSSSLLLIWPGLGFGYKSYEDHYRYTWWYWYGWGSDAEEIRTYRSRNYTDETSWSI
ncbi:10262_t:CDS:1, partial [Cetraspora pellucida]